MSNIALLMRSYVPTLRTPEIGQVVQNQVNGNLLLAKHAVRTPDIKTPARIVYAKDAVVFINGRHSAANYTPVS